MTISDLLSATMFTAVICGLCVAIALPLGTLLSILLVRTNIYGRSLAWIALGSQLAVPLYAFAGSWSAGFGWQGWIVNPANWLGGSAVTAMQATWTSVLAVSVLHGMAAVPWIAIIIALGLYWSQASLEEVALLEMGWWRVVRSVLLPQLRPWLVAASVWCCLPVLTEMVITNLYQVPTLAEQIYFDASRGTITPWTYVAAAATYLITTLALFLAFLASPVHRRLSGGGLGLSATGFSQPPRSDRERLARQRTLALGEQRTMISLVVWCSLLFLVGLPLVNLLAKAGWQPATDNVGRVTYGWSTARLVTTLYESCTLFTAEIRWSLVLAVASTIAALSLTSLLAALPGRLMHYTVTLIMLALICTPAPLVGMALIWLFNRESPAWMGYLYDRTLCAPILAQQFRLLPLAWLLVQTILAATPSAVWELAGIDGLNRWEKLRLVVGKHNWMRWLAAALVLFGFSLGELSCSILVLPPGVTTLAMRLFEMLHFGMRHQDSGLCGLLFLVGWTVSFVVWKTLKDR